MFSDLLPVAESVVHLHIGTDVGFQDDLDFLNAFAPSRAAELRTLAEQGRNAALQTQGLVRLGEEIEGRGPNLRERTLDEVRADIAKTERELLDRANGVEPTVEPRGVDANGDIILSEGESILFQPSAGGFTVNLSTDDLAAWAAGKGLGMAPGGTASLLEVGDIPVNVWARGRIAVLDGGKSGIDGVTNQAQFGAAFGVTPDVTLGLFGSAMLGDIESSRMALDMETSSVGGGAYASIRVFSSFDLGLAATYEFGKADVVNNGASGSYDTDRLGLSVSVSGAEFVGAWVLTPGVSFDFTRDHRDSYVDSANLAVPGGTEEDYGLSAGLHVSRIFLMEEGALRTVAPWADVTLGYAFRENDEITISATESETASAFSANAGLGVNLGFEQGLRLGLGAGVLSLGQDTIAYFGQIRLTMPLN